MFHSCLYSMLCSVFASLITSMPKSPASNNRFKFKVTHTFYLDIHIIVMGNKVFKNSMGMTRNVNVWGVSNFHWIKNLFFKTCIIL